MMKYSVILLFLFPSICFSDTVNLYLIQTLKYNEFVKLEKWTDPVSFITLGVELNIDNTKVIIIHDQNLAKGYCDSLNKGDQLFYLRSSSAIKSSKLMIRVNKPCTTKEHIKADLLLEVLTIDRKKFVSGLTF